MQSDRSFDAISKKFKNNIYGTAKGKIREAVLLRDLTPLVANCTTPLKILDVGGGQGQVSMALAKYGHRLTLLDVSEDMLAQAKANAEHLELEVDLIHAPLQTLSEEDTHHHTYDLVLCHAVFEWLADPLSAISTLKKCLKPNGTLSLMFFNADAKQFANIVYGNFEYLEAGFKAKKKVKLSPQNPLKPNEVITALAEQGLRVTDKIGVRCFYDYMKDTRDLAERDAKVLALELKHNREEPFASLGRYIHLIAKPE